MLTFSGESEIGYQPTMGRQCMTYNGPVNGQKGRLRYVRQEGLCLHATKNEGIREAGWVGGEVRRMQATQWTPCGEVASVYSGAQRRCGQLLQEYS